MPTQAERLGLPFRPFLYHLDQIAHILQVDSVDRYVHFDGRSMGMPPRDKLLARNIAPRGETPEWRVEEREVIRWFRAKGFTGVRRGTFT